MAGVWRLQLPQWHSGRWQGVWVWTAADKSFKRQGSLTEGHGLLTLRTNVTLTAAHMKWKRNERFLTLAPLRCLGNWPGWTFQIGWSCCCGRSWRFQMPVEKKQNKTGCVKIIYFLFRFVHKFWFVCYGKYFAVILIFTFSSKLNINNDFFTTLNYIMVALLII